MPNGDDHDAIVRLIVKIDALCTTISKFEKDNKEDHMLIFNKIDTNNESIIGKHLTLQKEKVPWGNFKWIMGGICTLILISLLGIGGMTLNTEKEVAETKHMLQDHIYYAGAIYKKVTGLDWSDQSREALDEAKKAFLKSQEDKKKRLKGDN